MASLSSSGGLLRTVTAAFPQFRTLDGDIAFDVFSQGTQSVLQWLAYVLISYAKYYGYPSNLAEQPGIMIIDEIDAHLHPTAQQRIIPILRRHFPKMQIFCSTHSPLMLVDLQPGQIQLLQRDSHGTVTVSRNATAMPVSQQMPYCSGSLGYPLPPVSLTEETPAPTRDRRSARPRTTSPGHFRTYPCSQDREPSAIVVGQVTPARTNKWLPPASQTETSGAA